jgi:hypothetical protein
MNAIKKIIRYKNSQGGNQYFNDEAHNGSFEGKSRVLALQGKLQQVVKRCKNHPYKK